MPLIQVNKNMNVLKSPSLHLFLNGYLIFVCLFACVCLCIVYVQSERTVTIFLYWLHDL